MAYHANDLGRRGKLLDRLPNVYPETAAVLAEMGRQPETAHDFFVKYQDRLLFGKDSFQPDEYPVLLAHVRDRGRVFRLLPRLPRVLEAVRHEPARRRAQEAVLRERAQARARSSADRIPADRPRSDVDGPVRRHRRGRVHRLASRGSAARARRARPRRRQSFHRQARQPGRTSAGVEIDGRRPRRFRVRARGPWPAPTTSCTRRRFHRCPGR